MYILASVWRASPSTIHSPEQPFRNFSPRSKKKKIYWGYGGGSRKWKRKWRNNRRMMKRFHLESKTGFWINSSYPIHSSFYTYGSLPYWSPDSKRCRTVGMKRWADRHTDLRSDAKMARGRTLKSWQEEIILLFRRAFKEPRWSSPMRLHNEVHYQRRLFKLV